MQMLCILATGYVTICNLNRCDINEDDCKLNRDYEQVATEYSVM